MIQRARLRSCARALLLAGVAVAPWTSPWLSPVLVASLGLYVLAAWARRIAGDDRALVPLIGGVFLVHVTLAVALFSVSYFGLPVFSDLQLGYGFWAFSADSDGYHFRALDLLEDLRLGHPLPPRTSRVVYELFLAAVYAWFGPLPLTPVLINAWFVAAAGLLGYLLARQFGAGRIGRYAAVVVVTCWPAGFIWSSQILRDSMALFLMWASLTTVVLVLEAVPQRRATTAMWALAFACIFAVTAIRPQVGWLFVVVSAAIVAATGLGVLRKTNGVRNALGVLLVAVIGSVAGSGIYYVSTFYVSVDFAQGLTPTDLSPTNVSSESAPSDGGAAAAAAASERRRAAAAVSDRRRAAAALSERRRAAIEAPRTRASEARRARASSEPAPIAAAPDAQLEDLSPFGGIDIVPRLLEQKRREYLIGANAVIGGNADVATWVGFFGFLPEALANVLFAPFPWDWSSGVSTGAFKSFAMIEGVMLMMLFPVLVTGLVRIAKTRRSGTAFVLVYGAIALLFIGMIVPSLGNLVRQRSQALLPLFVLAVAAGGLDVYPKFIDLVRRSRRGALRG